MLDDFGKKDTIILSMIKIRDRSQKAPAGGDLSDIGAGRGVGFVVPHCKASSQQLLDQIQMSPGSEIEDRIILSEMLLREVGQQRSRKFGKGDTGQKITVGKIGPETVSEFCCPCQYFQWLHRITSFLRALKLLI